MFVGLDNVDFEEPISALPDSLGRVKVDDLDVGGVADSLTFWKLSRCCHLNK